MDMITQNFYDLNDYKHLVIVAVKKILLQRLFWRMKFFSEIVNEYVIMICEIKHKISFGGQYKFGDP